jgi:hypothetical protein
MFREVPIRGETIRPAVVQAPLLYDKRSTSIAMPIPPATHIDSIP